MPSTVDTPTAGWRATWRRSLRKEVLTIASRTLGTLIMKLLEDDRWGSSAAVAIAAMTAPTRTALPVVIGPVRRLLMKGGGAPRPRAFTARNECVLAVDSMPSPTPARGLALLDQAWRRGAAAPAAWCRGGGAFRCVRDVLLRIRSCHGPPMLPGGGGWGTPTRSLSAARSRPLLRPAPPPLCPARAR